MTEFNDKSKTMGKKLAKLGFGLILVGIFISLITCVIIILI